VGMAFPLTLILIVLGALVVLGLGAGLIISLIVSKKRDKH